MAYLLEKCKFSILNESVLDSCHPFSCGHDDLNDFFKNDAHNYSKELLGKSYCFRLDENPAIIVCAFTIANDSIKASLLPNARKKKLIKHIPPQKHFKSYPAVLIGRLGVNENFKNRGIGSELMNFIKSWFIDQNNKTGCRFIVVDSYNEDSPKKYYENNSFEYLFFTEEQEKQYTGQISKTHLDTRLMYFDLIILSSENNK